MRGIRLTIRLVAPSLFERPVTEAVDLNLVRRLLVEVDRAGNGVDQLDLTVVEWRIHVQVADEVCLMSHAHKPPFGAGRQQGRFACLWITSSSFSARGTTGSDNQEEQ